MERTGISGYGNHISKTTSEKFYLVERNALQDSPKVNSNETKDNPRVARGVWKSQHLIFLVMNRLYLLASVAEFPLRVGKSFMHVKSFSPGFHSPPLEYCIAGLSCLSCSVVFSLLSLLEVVPTTVLLLLNYILNLYRLITESLWLWTARRENKRAANNTQNETIHNCLKMGKLAAAQFQLFLLSAEFLTEGKNNHCTQQLGKSTLI